MYILYIKNAKTAHLNLDGLEEDKEGRASVVLHVVVHDHRQPVRQHLVH